MGDAAAEIGSKVSSLLQCSGVMLLAPTGAFKSARCPPCSVVQGSGDKDASRSNSHSASGSAPPSVERFALRPLEGVLETGARDTTYKFALLRAVTDYVREHPTETGDEHAIPFSWIASKWLHYYWPLLVSDTPVPQGIAKRGKRATALEGLFHDHVAATRAEGASVGHTAAPSVAEPWGWFHVEEELKAGNRLDARTRRLILKVRRVVLDQPARYLPNVPGGRADVVGLRLGDESAWEPDAYEDLRRAALAPKTTKPLRKTTSLDALFAADSAALVLPARLYDAIRRTRFWVRGAVLAEWALFSTRVAARSGVDAGDAIMRLQETDWERETAVIRHYRGILRDRQELLCIWCARTLDPMREWDIDHILPWSRYPVNAFWNLAPSCKRCNRGPGGKFDKLVELNPTVEGRLEAHYAAVMATGDTVVAADLRSLTRGHGRVRDAGDVLDHLVGVHRELAETAGVGRWRVPSA